MMKREDVWWYKVITRSPGTESGIFASCGRTQCPSTTRFVPVFRAVFLGYTFLGCKQQIKQFNFKKVPPPYQFPTVFDHNRAVGSGRKWSVSGVGVGIWWLFWKKIILYIFGLQRTNKAFHFGKKPHPPPNPPSPPPHPSNGGRHFPPDYKGREMWNVRCHEMSWNGGLFELLTH